MQDKEFDELFRSKLNELEIQPTMHVWENIDIELSTGRRRKVWAPFLSIAASIIVLVAAGILFIPQKTKLNNKHTVQSKLVKTIVPVNIVQRSNTNSLSPGNVNKLPNNVVLANNIASLHPAKTAVHFAGKNKRVVKDTLKNAQINEQPLLASASQKIREEINPVVPDANTQLLADEEVKDNSAFIEKPTVAATQPTVNEKHIVTTVKKKSRIRSFGDLINVVVAKVDKRKDKIIEFSNTDDDEATITGINLGIIKIKKEEK